jgi:hypothetical protein
MLTNYLELLISSYYNIVKRTMIDMVPKAIMLTLVQYVSFASFLPTSHLTCLQVYQGRDAARTFGKHVPNRQHRRTVEGERLHHQETEGVPADGRVAFQGQRDCQPSTVMAATRISQLIYYDPHHHHQFYPFPN